MTVAAPQLLDDVSVVAAGQGGDGSLTVTTLLASLLRQRGLSVYTERDVLSRIRGGHAAAMIRASVHERFVGGDDVQLVIAFDEEGVRTTAHRLAPDAVIVYDDSAGPLGCVVPEGARIYAAPFGRLAVRHLGAILYKNSIAIGVATRVLGLDDGEVRTTFEERFRRYGQLILNYNMQALDLGYGLADEMGLQAGGGIFELRRGAIGERLLITGNEALAFGFLVAGGRFFAGYPITPASEIMDWLERTLPRFGGVVWQAEDELAAVNMTIGAALAGVRAMTATSGPGLALMQEGIGQAGSAEIPLVVVDSQRGGPSTGLPTKPEQSDLNMMVFGGNGEFPRIVLAPGHPEDCFTLAVEACNLAQRYQCPVYLAMDQGTSQNLATLEPFDLERVEVDQGKRLNAEQLAAAGVYQRYAFTDDGVSPYTVPGTPGGMSLVTGNERDEFGRVSTDRINRARMVDKRALKLERALDELPAARRYGDPAAPIGFVGIGAAFGPILEAMEELESRGLTNQFLQPRTVWPVLEETLEFVAQCERVYVVEQNATGQLAKLLVREGAESAKIRNVLRYDGTPLRSGHIVQDVLAQESKS